MPDQKFRQALLYAIDRNQILEQLLKGNGEVVDGFLSTAGPYYDPSIEPVSYDPAKAKELLAEVTGCLLLPCVSILIPETVPL